jgi:hypothetical protein
MRSSTRCASAASCSAAGPRIATSCSPCATGSRRMSRFKPTSSTPRSWRPWCPGRRWWRWLAARRKRILRRCSPRRARLRSSSSKIPATWGTSARASGGGGRRSGRRPHHGPSGPVASGRAARVGGPAFRGAGRSRPAAGLARPAAAGPGSGRGTPVGRPRARPGRPGVRHRARRPLGGPAGSRGGALGAADASRRLELEPRDRRVRRPLRPRGGAGNRRTPRQRQHATRSR